MLNPAQVGGIVGGGCAVLVGTTSVVVALARRRTHDRTRDNEPTAPPAETVDRPEAATARLNSPPEKDTAQGRSLDRSPAGPAVQTVEHQPGNGGAKTDDPVETWLVPDPWAKRPVDDSSNGDRRETVSTPNNRDDALGVARAERSAVELLREAGYGVNAPQMQLKHSEMQTSPSQPELSDVLREFLSQRVITVAIMEEATRRMRAENARLEEALGRNTTDPELDS